MDAMTAYLYETDGTVVHTAELPPADIAPTVVVWGARMFTFTRDSGRDEHGVRQLHYSEQFGVVVE